MVVVLAHPEAVTHTNLCGHTAWAVA